MGFITKGVGGLLEGIGINSGGLPVVSDLFGWNPAQEKLMKEMEEAKAQYGEHDARMQDARMQAMKQIFAMYGPLNQMVGEMMGQKGPAMPPDVLNQAMQNPMGPPPTTPDSGGSWVQNPRYGQGGGGALGMAQNPAYIWKPKGSV